MPLYEYVCKDGHLMEQLAAMDQDSTVCSCGQLSIRNPVNRVGVSGFAETPRDQKNYRKEFAEFKEASAEVDYHYSRAEREGQPVKAPNLFKAGVAQAQR